MSEENVPKCFGDPDEVSPLGPHGFPEPQKKCLGCSYLKPCLRQAWKKRHPKKEETYAFEEHEVFSKISNFYKRWSKRKLNRTSS